MELEDYSKHFGFLKHHFRDQCQIRQKEAEIVAIESAVHELIHKILQLVEEECSWFKISRILPSGSFYEGTKIGNLDEFDYMIVLQALSQDDIELQDGCSPWYKRIKLTDKSNYFERYCSAVAGSGHPLTVIAIICLIQGSSSQNFGKLSGIPESAYEDEDCRVIVPVHRMDIGIDLMMAIEHPCLESVAKCEGFPSEYKELLMKLGCHIVIKSCHIQHFPEPACYFISFASLELEMMKNLDKHHKKCYKILKSLLTSELNFSGKCMHLSSYVLKTAFLFHVYGENGCTYSRLNAKCIFEVLNYLSSCFYNLRMPCFFARDMNTWGHILEFPVIRGTAFDYIDLFKSKIIAFSFLWMKLWYKIVHFVKTTISEYNNENIDEWYTITDKCGYMKTTIYYILEKYTDWTNSEVLKGVGIMTNEELNGKNLASCSDEQFSYFVEDLQKVYNIKLDFLL
ncbi:uncharacterized protein LOC134710977 [Mytilus trossulus]|uniref:uncharacterized protein LOC134710977 n=1 Tax=Mytilus trossulus TaxID=6551 RepID=UPI0030076745